MTTEQNEETTSQKSEETSDSTTEESTNDESTEKSNDVDVLKKKMADLESKNRQLYERTNKAELKAKGLEATKLSEEVKETKQTKQESGFDPLDSVKLFNALKDYSQDEVDLISRQAKAYGISIDEATQNEDVKLLIEARREKLKKDNASPTPSTRQAPVDKDFSNWKPEDIKPLTDNPSPENRKRLSEYVAWARAQK